MNFEPTNFCGKKRSMLKPLAGALVLATGICAAPASAVNTEINGVYNVWGISQNSFFFGKKKDSFGSDNDNYVVQMLRLKVSLADDNDDIKAITRFDLAQGWWGVDNAGDKSVDGGQFYDKGTFFDVHVDHAYLDFRVPNTESRVMVGRFHHALGNKLVLDDDLDGIRFTAPMGNSKLSLAFAKPFEGDVDLTGQGATPVGDQSLNTLNDEGSTDDANMFSIAFDHKMGGNNLSAWYVYYADEGYDDGSAYITQGLGYARPRFTPQVTELNIFGGAATFKMGSVTLNGEFNYLSGQDDIANDTYNGNKNDKNNGDLEGYTAYLDAKLGLGEGGKSNVGVKFGIGSGDDDPSSGEGNITKLKTQGFFYFTEVWEDSIMPDVAGITPQGIGAPNTKGYREFENTTAVQLYANFALSKSMSIFGSYSYMMATEDVHGWNADGPTSQLSDDIGQEVDAIFKWKLYKKLIFSSRFGYFMPGEATLLLVNGNTANDDDAWEWKNTLTFKF
ncbi:hypothetical protein PN36_16585 [Candidatus Thiomargarita nelsonii]|uniref:Uncharacterized protein n=1 Tax=Candidatus Thiomargarita nelsonii TaxID=1003181 RepID=A0A0A6P5Q7_9GAMM|nr:hypothetical protein PN36_16585 [Candidatus Thiomargarita nelsonii]